MRIAPQNSIKSPSMAFLLSDQRKEEKTMIYSYGFYAIKKLEDGTFLADGPDGEIKAATLDEIIRVINDLEKNED